MTFGLLFHFPQERATMQRNFWFYHLSISLSRLFGQE